MRQQITLSREDGAAALEILAFLAHPQRPEYGLRVMNDWARHHFGNQAGAEKWSRLEPKLRRCDGLIERSLVAGYWLHRRCALSFSDRHSQELGPVEASLRTSARAFGIHGKEETALRDYWDRSRTVAHLALAAGEAIHSAFGSREATGWQWSLRDIAFNPAWVDRAVTHAEAKAQAASELGVIPIEDALHFVR